MLIHGFPLDHSMWTGQIEALAVRHRVIAPDLRGFGRSGASDGTVSMRRFADDLAGLLDALGMSEPVTLCGLSMGGYIAFSFWEAYASRVAALILCDTRAAADTAQTAASRQQTAGRVLQEGPHFLIEAMIPKLFATSTIQQQPDLVAAQQQVILSTAPQGIAAASRGMAERPDVTARLGSITCPVLVLAGQHDGISPPAEMRAMAQALPRARFVEIPAASHMSPLEQPAAVNRAIQQFLDLLP